MNNVLLLATFVRSPSIKPSITWHSFDGLKAIVKQQQGILAAAIKDAKARDQQLNEFLEIRTAAVEREARELAKRYNSMPDDEYGRIAAKQALQRVLYSKPSYGLAPTDILVHGVDFVDGYTFLRFLNLDPDLFAAILSAQRDAIVAASNSVMQLIEKTRLSEKYLIQ